MAGFQTDLIPKGSSGRARVRGFPRDSRGLLTPTSELPCGPQVWRVIEPHALVLSVKGLARLINPAPKQPALDARVAKRIQARAIACENTTSINVPKCGPVLMWNWARLASTRALVSDRLTPELSEA